MSLVVIGSGPGGYVAAIKAAQMGQSVTVIEDTVVVEYPNAPWELLTRGFFDATDPLVIQKSFVMLNIYIGIETACRLFHLCESSEAIGVLESLIAAVEDFNEEVQDVDMDYDLQLMSDLIEVIELNGGEQPDEWDLPEDPWPAD